MSGGAGAGAAVRQGHLRKLKNMKKKYFVLRAETSECSARLEYYESEKKFRGGAAPRRVLPLKSCYNITRRLDLKQKHVIALFTREEQFCVAAENEQDLHAWLSALLKLHSNDDASDELLHPIQHVWQVNVEKKGLGATKNIQGLYNLCLTDKTLTLVKIKSHNNVISDLGILERVEYSLKNIRRCGDSERFFYMEVGRQTTTGSGELWMHTEDVNIAQSMHSTILHAMRNCAKENENERDHIVLPKGDALPARRQTFSSGGARPGFADAGTLRNRCDSMPSRACSSFEVPDRPPPRFNSDFDSALEISRDEADSSDWYRTPRIPEEPDCCDISRDFMNTSLVTAGSVAHSRTSSVGETGYLPMAPGHDALASLISASSGSLCSGTPSTDPRFSEYQLEPATSHIGVESRPPRAYSVGSRPAPGPPAHAAPEGRHRAYSVGARARPPRPPRASDDHMEIDFSNNSPAHRAAQALIARTPPSSSFVDRPKTNVDEYVDMSPRNAGYVEMRPGELTRTPPATPAPPTPDGYMEMNYGRAPTRPIAIAAPRPAAPPAASPDESRGRTPHGSQTLFDMSLDSPASPLEPPDALEEDPPHHALSTIREDGRRSPQKEVPKRCSVSSSPQYVTLARGRAGDELSCNPTATKTIARTSDVSDTRAEAGGAATLVLAGGGAAARFSVADDKRSPPPAPPAAPCAPCAPLNYAALDLEPRRGVAGGAPRAYTQIDFIRSEKLHAADT